MKWLNKCLIASGVVFGLSVSGQTTPPAQIIRVEEDWELVVETPDPLTDAPQVSTWMFPSNDQSDGHFGVDLNHAQRPDYEGGGLQTKSYLGEALVDDKLENPGSNLNSNGESVRWTQLIAIVGNELVFAVKNGQSSSWGSFGGPSTAVKLSSNLSNLNDYSPSRSIQSSGIGFAANRVGSLKLVRIRAFLSNGTYIQTDLNHELK
jgi:hypothetical protein